MNLKHRTGNVGGSENLNNFSERPFVQLVTCQHPRIQTSHVVPDYWRGSASLGSRIMTSSTNWRNDSRGLSNEWHFRAWRQSARSRARQLIESWINSNNSWRAGSWQPDNGAARCQFGFLL